MKKLWTYSILLLCCSIVAVEMQAQCPITTSGSTVYTYEEAFTSGVGYQAGDPQVDNYTAFRAGLGDTTTTKYTSVTFSSSISATSFTLTDRYLVRKLAHAMKNGINFSGLDNNRTLWGFGNCAGANEFYIGFGCNCSATASLRPDIDALSLPGYWGGIGQVCSSPSQTLKLEFVAETETNNVTCNGTNDGYISIATTGGTPPYTYNWSNGAGNVNALTNLAGGAYTVTITDANCSIQETFNIAEPTAINITDVVTNNSCGGSIAGGAIDITVSGGTTPYTYSWSNNSTTEDLTNISSGTYSLTVTDAINCTQNTTIVVADNLPLNIPTATASSNSPTGNPICGGTTLTLSESGGDAVSWSWTGPNGFTSTAQNPTVSTSATAAMTGNYTVLITNANGCQETATTTVVVDAIDIQATITNVSCKGGSDGVIDLSGITFKEDFESGTYSNSFVDAGNQSYNMANISGNYYVEVSSGSGSGELYGLKADLSNVNYNRVSFDVKTSNMANSRFIIAGTFLTTAIPFLMTPQMFVPPNAVTYTTSYNRWYNVEFRNINFTTSTFDWYVDGKLMDANLNFFSTPADGSKLWLYSQGYGVTAYDNIIFYGNPSNYTYSWSTGATTSSIDNLTAGTYTVTVTNTANSCSAEVFTYNVTEPAGITASTSMTACSNGTDGELTITASDGASPYTYSNDGGATYQASNVFSGLAAGNYNILVKDANDCTSAAQSVAVTPCYELTAVQTQAVTCPGGNDGAAQVTIAGGTAPFTLNGVQYQSNTIDVTGLTAGTQTFTVTDASSPANSASVSVVITDPTPTTPNAVVSTIHNGAALTCIGATDGTITVEASLPDISQVLSSIGDGSNTFFDPNAITSDAAGNIYVVGTGSNNAYKISATGTITEIIDATGDGTHALAQPTGIAVDAAGNVFVSGQGSDNVFKITPAGVITQIIDSSGDGINPLDRPDLGLAVDAAGNVYVAAYTSNNVFKITPAGVITQIIDGSGDGSNFLAGASDLTVDAAGNVYVTGWNSHNAFKITPSGMKSQIIGAAGDGTNALTNGYGIALDAAGNAYVGGHGSNNVFKITASGAISQVLDASGDGANPLSNPTGIATDASGNVYVSGQGSNNIFKITSGGTIAEVADQSGDGTNSLTTPMGIATTASGMVYTTGRGSDNVFQIAPNTTGLTYSIDGGAFGTNNVFTGLGAGTYTFSVKDSKGCVATTTGTITAPTAVSLTTASTGASCNGGNDGTATVTATGGTIGSGTYTYQWDAAAANQTTATATNLAAGTYSVTVTDANGCMANTSVVVGESSTLIVTEGGTTMPTCNGDSDGTATVTATGGTAPYTYKWDTVSTNLTTIQTTATATGLAAGMYSVTVTDANNCSDNITITVGQPSMVTATDGGSTMATCFGNSDGTATVTAAGGTTPYTYTWDAMANNQITAAATGLAAGTYSVTVADANGCMANTTVTVGQPTALAASISSSTNILCNGSSTGAIDLMVTGGTAPYQYSWSNGTNVVSTMEDPSNLAAGTYTVMVTDANNCAASASATLTENSAIVATIISTTDVACNGGNTGTIDLMVTGGTAPYQYSWSDGTTTVSTMEDPTGLTAGAYSVMITDANNCTMMATAAISESSNMVVTETITNLLCNGTGTGAVSVSVTGGNAPYTYNWSNGGTTPTISGLMAGTYNLTVTDGNQCNSVSSFMVTEPTVLMATASVVNEITCNGATDGSVMVTVTGGTGNYTYQWATGGTMATLANVGAGTYSVVVTDANNCSTTANVTIGEPTALTATANVDANVTCNGGNNGGLTVMTAGGTAPYQYQLNGGTAQGTGVFTGLMAGTYSVMVTDAKGCTISVTETITAPSAISITSTATDASCNGKNDGSATITATGGTAPYTYAWSANANGATGTMLTDLTAGTYTVTVTDANNCTQTASVTINEPTSLTATATMNTAVSCFGGNNGSATITTTGGTAPYTYNWGNGEQTAQATILTAGTYTPTVTDANGCTTTATVMITEPTALSASAATTANVSCAGGADGSITVTAMGGTTPYTYSWSNGGTMATLTGAAAGIYTVTVTDANGCVAVSGAAVVEPTALAITSTTTDATCNGGTGSATIIATGGTAPYTYAWSNGGTMATLTGAAAGIYTVTVTDANSCTMTHSVTIGEPVALSAIAGATNTTGFGNSGNSGCFGSTDGGIFVSVQGGTAPYTYSWSNGATTANISNLGAGTYTVTITDANGCTTTASGTITGPSQPLAASIAGITNLMCNDADDGTINLNVSGGIAPYTYFWTNGDTTQNPTGLDVGYYQVIVTDANGCSVTADTTLSEPSQLAINATSTASYNGYDVSCNGQTDGGVTLSVNGGTAPYTYAWATGETTENLSNLGAGTYSVVVTDANGCSNTASITLTQPMAVMASISSTINNTCNGSNDGSAMVTATGGVAPYSYAWDNGQTSQTATNLSAGIHIATVTDANGCTVTATATISEPTILSVGVNTTQQITCAGGTGDIASIVAGGTAPYAYSWSNGMTTADLTGVGAGAYSLTVTDANGCTATQSITLSDPVAIIASVTTMDVSCNGQADGAADLTVTGGTAPYTFAWDNNQTTEDLAGLAAGTYTVVITDANGCTTTATATITEPATLSATTMATDAACNGGMGSVSLTVSGGTAPYTYAWDNNSTQMNLMQAAAGTYNVTVTDANGCTATAAAVVSEPAAIAVTSTVTAVTCNGQTDGAIMTTITGGTAPYTYDWGGGTTTQNLSNLAAGTYTVTVTDGMGCTMMHTATVTEPTTLTVTGVTTAITCNGQADGTITTTVAGGIAPYTYDWSNAATGADLTNVGAGSYSVIVTDANGCQANATFQITMPAALSVTLTTQGIACNGGTGSLNSLVSGGTAPYTVAVTDAAGATVANPNSVTAGTYTVSVTDANGCSTSEQITLTEPTAIAINSLIVEDVLCAGEATGSILLDVTGGAGTYTYNWSTNQGINNNANNLTAGNYSVTVTDFNGCTATGSFTINEPTALTLTLSGGDDPNNAGKVELTATAGGGVAPYTYSWSGNAAGQTGSVASNITSGVFTVVVTDANGCSIEATETVIATGTETLTNVSKLSLFPNPTVGQATIELELTEAADVNIVVYNVAGIKVQEFGNEYTTQARHQMDLTQFAAGVYLVRVTIDEAVITKRLVVVRP